MSESTDKPGNERERWLSRLKREKDAHKPFREESKEAYSAFIGEREDKRETLYPIFWANSKITHSAIFSRQPKPDVRRRQTDGQGDKQIALAIERALAHQQDTTFYDDHTNRAVMDFIVAGLGQTRYYLKTDTAESPVINTLGEPAVDDAGKPVTQLLIAGQYVCCEFIPFDQFRWEPTKDWEDVNWIAFDHYMTGSKIKADFGVDVAESQGGGEDKAKPRAQKYAEQYLVHEIWDRKSRSVIFVSDAVSNLWSKEADKLKLKGFYPCPRPMLANLRSNELMPRPEYWFIRRLCDDINVLTGRITALTKQVKDVGFYDAHFKELGALMQESDGARIPVTNLVDKLNGVAAMQNVVVTEDNSNKVQTIQVLTGEREKLKAELYELTGISDIVRGASQASETATAQQLKGQWANVRLSEKMREVAMHFRNGFRIMAELIAEHFDPAQIAAQTGVELTPEQINTMRSDMGRVYAIDIESDSTIAQDEQQEKTDRIEFFQQVTGALANLMPQAQQGIMPADLVNALLMFVTRSFRHGRMLEEQIEALPNGQAQLQKMQEQTQQVQQQAEQLQQQMDQQAQQAAQAQQQAQQQMEADQQQIAKLSAQVDQMKAAEQARKDFEAQSKAQSNAASADLALARAAQIRDQSAMNTLATQGAMNDPFGSMLPPIA